MKLQIQTSALRQALSEAAKNIGKKPAAVIMENVLLTQREGDGKFFFTTANGGDSVLTLPVDLELVEGSFGKPIVLPFNDLSKLIATLPGDTMITLAFSGKDNLEISYCLSKGENVKTGKVNLAFFPADDFPDFAEVKDITQKIHLPNYFFKKALTNAGKFCGNDELRPIMNTLCFDLKEDLSQLVAAASDGHSLYKTTLSNDTEHGGYDFYCEGKPGRTMVCSCFFSALSVFEKSEDVYIETNGSLLQFYSGDITFKCRGVDGNYPNYDSVIPKDSPSKVIFDKREFLDVLKRVGLFASESSNCIRMEKDGMFLNLSAEDIDFSRAATEEVLITDSECPDHYAIGFNGIRLRDALAAIPGDSVCINLGDSRRAAVITADEPAPNTLLLVMPMLLNN